MTPPILQGVRNSGNADRAGVVSLGNWATPPHLPLRRLLKHPPLILQRGRGNQDFPTVPPCRGATTRGIFLAPVSRERARVRGRAEVAGIERGIVNAKPMYNTRRPHAVLSFLLMRQLATFRSGNPSAGLSLRAPLVCFWPRTIESVPRPELRCQAFGRAVPAGSEIGPAQV